LSQTSYNRLQATGISSQSRKKLVPKIVIHKLIKHLTIGRKLPYVVKKLCIEKEGAQSKMLPRNHVYSQGPEAHFHKRVDPSVYIRQTAVSQCSFSLMELASDAQCLK
jgi:hypothetical protein